MRHDRGFYTWTNGETYDGEWKNGEKNGYGTFNFLDGDGYNRDVYVGEWKDDKKHGKGKMIYTNGDDMYDGMWKDDEKD